MNSNTVLFSHWLLSINHLQSHLIIQLFILQHFNVIHLTVPPGFFLWLLQLKMPFFLLYSCSTCMNRRGFWLNVCYDAVTWCTSVQIWSEFACFCKIMISWRDWSYNSVTCVNYLGTTMKKYVAAEGRNYGCNTPALFVSLPVSSSS